MPAECRRDENQGAIVAGHLSLSLLHVDLHGGLTVGSGGEYLALLRRYRRVAFDQSSHDAAERLDAEGKRGDVQQQDVVDFASQDAGLDGRPKCHHLVWIHAPVGFFVEQRFY